MSKQTETTNERVPRDIVRIGTTVGKHTEAHGSVGKHTEAHGSTRKRGGAHGWLDEALPKGYRRGTETCGTLGTRGRGAWGLGFKYS